jgi:guanylate kinase
LLDYFPKGNTEQPMKSGLLIVVSGPSGVGKGAILQGGIKRLPTLRRSVSVTTRPPRAGESEGESYFFRSPAEFEQLKTAGELLEWARYLDYFYGTPRDWVKEKLQAGIDVALEIDVQGGQQVKKSFPAAVLVFVAPPSKEVLRQRLLGRNTEAEEIIARRLAAYEEELKALPLYDYLVVNDVLGEAVDRFCSIITAEKSRVNRSDFHG